MIQRIVTRRDLSKASSARCNVRKMLGVPWIGPPRPRLCLSKQGQKSQPSFYPEVRDREFRRVGKRVIPDQSRRQGLGEGNGPKGRNRIIVSSSTLSDQNEKKLNTGEHLVFNIEANNNSILTLLDNGSEGELLDHSLAHRLKFPSLNSRKESHST
jgi:hypothetical protein